MATYVVGDIQGCFEPLQRLLDSAEFNPTIDNVWFAGDLVNRGPDSLKVLRFIKNLGTSAVAILGNHDLHLLAAEAGVRKPSAKDTIDEILSAPDKEELIHWLRHRPLVHVLEQPQGTYVMSHAGIPHVWDYKEAVIYAREVETLLRSEESVLFFENMYGNKPKRWKHRLQGWERLRVITNYLTRMRFVDQKGRIDFECKGPSYSPPLGMRPWYSYPRKPMDSRVTFLFGHWAALEGITGNKRFIALDTGCVWGGALTMLRLEDHKLFQVPNSPTK